MSISKRTAVLRKVFSTRPATLQDSYVKSYAFEYRYALLSGGKLEREAVFINENIPTWLKKIQSLGDYEKSFLNDILQAPGRVIAYRSGTGSGKSSLVGAIADAIAKFSNQRNWEETLHCRSFAAIIDLQAADSADVGISAKLDENTRSDDKIDYYDEKLFGMLAAKIIDTLFYLCDSQNLKQILQLMNRNDEFKRSSPYRELLNEIRADLNSDADLLAARLLNFLIAKSGKEKFDIIMHLFVFIGYLHKMDITRGKHGKSFVLFIDNSDKLHHVLLTRLINHLKEFSVNTERFKSDLKVALFLRLSTSKDQIGAIAEADYRYYSSPDPIDIVLHKALNFVLGPAEHLKSFFHKDVLGAKFSVLELILELLDGRIRDFPDSLDALSGTNIRNAFTRVIAWCASPALNVRSGTSGEFGALAQEFAYLFLFNEIRSIVRKFDNFLLGELKVFNGALKHFSARRISVKLDRIISDFMCEADRKEADINSRMKSLLMHHVSRDLSLMDELCRQAFMHAQMKIELLRVTNAVAQGNPRYLEIFLQQIEACLQGMNGRSDVGIPHEREVIRLSLIKSYLKNISDDLKSRSTGTIQADVAFPRRPNRADNQNRFERTMLLYDVESEDEESSLRPVNLISIDGRRIQTCSLRILYYLCEQQESRHSAASGVKYDELRSKLEAFGYGVLEIRESMRALTDLGSRLIYSRVADHHYYSAGDWERSFFGKGFFVSWAGYKYYDALLSNPTFVQWLLTNTSVIKARFTYDHERLDHVGSQVSGDRGAAGYRPRVVESMQNVLDGFNALIEYESHRLANITDLDARSVSHLCRSPSVDFMHRCTPGFLRTIRYVEGVRRERAGAGRLQVDEEEQFRDVKRGFLGVLERGQYLCDEYFGSFPLSWRGLYESSVGIIS